MLQGKSHDDVQTHDTDAHMYKVLPHVGQGGTLHRPTDRQSMSDSASAQEFDHWIDDAHGSGRKRLHDDVHKQGVSSSPSLTCPAFRIHFGGL